MVLVLYGINILLFVLAFLWVLIPALYKLPSKPTHPDRIRAALKLVNLQPGELLYDLGAGDGRVLLIAAKEFDAKVYGLEIAPVQYFVIWLRIVLGGLQERAQIRMKNFYKADLHDADVVYIYATSQELLKLASHLHDQMKPGSRIVSISADFTAWEPSRFDEKNLIFTYDMPPKEGSLTTYMLKNTK